MSSFFRRTTSAPDSALNPAPTSRPRRRATIAATVTIALVGASTLVGGVVPANAAPAATGLSGSIGHTGGQRMDFTAGRYIVTLSDEAVALYQGGVNGFSATMPGAGAKLDAQSRSAESYRNYLTRVQSEVAASVDATVGYSYTLALNGFAAQLSGKQAATLAAQRNVVSVVPDALRHVTVQSSTDFLRLSGPTGLWSELGGSSESGKGVVIGVLDTGIAPENPSFAGAALGTTPGAEPWFDGDTITMNKADGTTFTGTCQSGEQFTTRDCNTKVIGARYFLNGFGADQIGDASTGEYVSPRDGDGHGSHTASTAGGNVDVPTMINGVDFGVISGVAPAAKIAAYKVCWSGPDPSVTSDDGCADTDILGAIDQAISDGVDVINYSIGGGPAQTTFSATGQAFLGAAAAGIFVAASAGNDGPTASTLDNASPWITTVAASTIPSYEATATLGDGSTYAGASITVDRAPGATPLSGNLLRADLVSVDGFDPADALLCAPGALDPAKVAGGIVFCQRGVYDRVAKSAEVLRAGGSGMLLVNRTPADVDTDEHSVPSIHLDAPAFDPVFAYAATEAATVTFTPDNTTAKPTPVPQVAGFSSRGPVTADGGDLLKPDIAAPGVSILADGANAAGADPTFEFLSGTSMASPHIAGLAALILGFRPLATPAEIKSVMMTTAKDTVDANGDRVTDPFAQGAGQVNPSSFGYPGLVYQSGPADWLAYLQGIGFDAGVDPIDASNLNLPSIQIGALTAPETITRTVTAVRAGTYTAIPIEIPGVTAVVSPATMTFGAVGEKQSYTVTFTRTTAPLDEYATGSLDWSFGNGGSGDPGDSFDVVHSPIAVRPVTVVAPTEVDGTGVDGSVDVTVTPGGSEPVPLTLSGLATGLHQADPADPSNPHSGSGATGDQFSYEVELAGGRLDRFDLNAVDDSTDLDLFVLLLDGPGGDPVAGWQSATGSADEHVDIFDPEAGFYRIIVDVFSGSTTFDVNTFAVASGEPTSGFTATPATIQGPQGVPITYTLNWAGLTPNTPHLGVVDYGDSTVSTILAVAASAGNEPEAPMNAVAPSVSGTPEIGHVLTADPGQWNTEGLAFGYQWQSDGVDIAGATASTFTPRAALAGTTLTVVVTASKVGLPSASATSAGVVVKYAAKVRVTLNHRAVFSSSRVTVSVTVTSKGTVGDTATVTVDKRRFTVKLDAKGHGSVTLPQLGRGLYRVVGHYAGNDTVAAATSPARSLLIVR
ncbi:MAG: S8 family serine peptidase [Cryobacterium sp.]|uniref:S8 family peptidase n=1 Tax=unclassified Cryobacterium TaxID=2649013 RepID=UPI0018CBE9A1|nr:MULTISPECIES: S8 family peptidase [unclassified Cryobacterium]MCY7403535.1 S8 family serine peptidase [Cryobacterium sp.]MEC5153272.1 subtilisin family serine protease [Cryobacterium sp. CAN_C3]